MALDPDQARHGLTVLTRLAQRSPAGERQLARLLESDPDGLAVPAAEVAVETGEPIVGLLTALLRERPPSTETLLALHSRDPAGELGLVVHQLLADRIRDGGTEVDPYQAVDILAGLARRLLVARRRADALDVASRSVELGRALPAKFDKPSLLRALDALSRAQTATREHEAASETITEAVRAAERRFGGLAEPYLGVLLLTQAEQLRRAGHVAAAIEAYTRAEQVWREIRRNPDVDSFLVLRRFGDEPTGGHRMARFDSAGVPRPMSAIHVAIGAPSPELYEGPVLGDYRLNGVLAEDGKIYIGPRTWSPIAALTSLVAALCERGRTLLLLGEPRGALADLRQAAALLAEAQGGVPIAHAADVDFVLAHCLQWSGDTAAANEAAARACALLADLPELAGGPETGLSQQACLAVAAGVGRENRTWPRYFHELVALGRTRAPADGGRLLDAILGQVHVLAVTLKNEEMVSAAIPLLRLAIDATDDPARQAVSLVSLANTQLRAGDPAGAVATASRAVALATDPLGVATAEYALGRALTAAGRSGEAVAAHGRAVELVLAADPLAHPDFAVLVLSGHLRATPPADGRAELGEEVRLVVALLLTVVPELTDEYAGLLAELGFALVSQAAREGGVGRLRADYGALLEFTHARDTREARVARAVVAWNVAMCFVDHADWAAAHRALDDVGALVAAYPDEDLFRVEHGKCASELLAAYWNAGRHEDARAIVRAAGPSLRSPQYLEARRRDIGDPPESFLAVLDSVAGG